MFEPADKAVSRFPPAGDISFWFDRLCVDQHNLWVKVQTLQAVPAFVAQSTDLLVLWDHTWLGGTTWNFLDVHIRYIRVVCAPRHIFFVMFCFGSWDL